MGHPNPKRIPRYAPVLPGQMIPGPQHGSRVTCRRIGVARGRWTWVTDLFFWFFFLADVFGACCWPASRLGALAVRIGILSPSTATLVVLLSSAVLTPLVVRAIILFLKRIG